MSDAVCMLDGGWLYVDIMQNKGKKRCWGALETFNKKTNLANSLIKTKTKKRTTCERNVLQEAAKPLSISLFPFSPPCVV